MCVILTIIMFKCSSIQCHDFCLGTKNFLEVVVEAVCMIPNSAHLKYDSK